VKDQRLNFSPDPHLFLGGGRRRSERVNGVAEDFKRTWGAVYKTLTETGRERKEGVRGETRASWCEPKTHFHRREIVKKRWGKGGGGGTIPKKGSGHAMGDPEPTQLTFNLLCLSLCREGSRGGDTKEGDGGGGGSRSPYKPLLLTYPDDHERLFKDPR